MTTKEKVLQLFDSRKGTYYSGEELASLLGVSRAAIWKAVKALRNDGYCINAVTNKGYCLSTRTDILSAQGIRKYLRPEFQDLDIQIRPSVDSTNTLVRQCAEQGFPAGLTVLANQQTGGKGRGGRVFFSPAGTGLYLSMLLRPAYRDARQALRITTMAAVAMCQAIEAVSGETPRIKWVNDIFIRGKKICGILTEGSFNLETGLLCYAVLGVGLNVYPPEEGFPPELESIAGALFRRTEEDMKNRLAGEFLNRFLTYENSPHPEQYIELYRSYSLVIGRDVTVMRGGYSRTAHVLGIDDECRLQVRYEDGKTDSLSYGEIRIRPQSYL